MKKLLTAILLVSAFSSCSNFYRVVVTNGPATSKGIEDLRKQEKYFILRDTSRAYAMNNVTISPDGQSVQADLASIPDQHMTYVWKPRGEKPRYDKMNEPYVLNEVHLYMLPDSNMAPGRYTLPLKNVQATEILEKDKARTTRNHATAIILSLVGTAAVIAIITYAVAASALLSF
jgi:hypothetical protein